MRLHGIAFGWIVALAGCAPQGAEHPTARLAGKVSLDGEPIAQGRIHFMPNAGTPGVPVTADISAGAYAAPNVPVGSVTVTFSAVRQTGKTIQEGDRQPYPETVSIIPAKYAQGVPLTVAGDNAAQDFDLTAD